MSPSAGPRLGRHRAGRASAAIGVIAVMASALLVSPGSAGAQDVRHFPEPVEIRAQDSRDRLLRSSGFKRFTAPKCQGSQSVISQDGRYLFTIDDAHKVPDICVIDLQQRRVATRIRVHKDRDATALGLALSRDGQSLYVEVSRVGPTSFLGTPESIFVTIDIDTLRVVDSYKPVMDFLGVPRGMQAEALTPAEPDVAFFATYSLGRNGTVFRANLKAKEWTIVSGQAPNGVASMVVSRDVSTIWALGNRLARIDVASGRELASSSIVGSGWPNLSDSSLAISPDESTIHAVDRKKRVYAAFDARTLKLIRKVRLPLVAAAIAVTSDGKRVWVLGSEILPRVPETWPPPDGDPDEIWEFDAQGRQTRTFAMPELGRASSLAFAPTGRKAYINFRHYPKPGEILVADVGR